LIRHNICRGDLAAMAGVARENVSRVMGNWTRNKVVARSSGFYCLIDVTRLKRDMHSQDKWQRRAGDTNGTLLVGESPGV
jgi:hypothetical protein